MGLRLRRIFKRLQKFLLVQNMFKVTDVHQVYLYPGITDFRLGIYELCKLIGSDAKVSSIYIFANKALNAIKVIIPVYNDEKGTFHKSELPTPIVHSSIEASLLSDAMTIKEQRQSDPYQTLITNLESYIDP